MARQVNIPERVYQVGIIEHTLNSFPQNIAKIRVSLTRINWPGQPSDNVARIAIEWSNGTKAEWELPGGVVLTRSGQPLAASVVEVDVPEGAEGKRPVVTGLVTFEVRQALRTAISAEAI